MHITLDDACHALGIHDYHPNNRYECPCCHARALALSEGDRQPVVAFCHARNCEIQRWLKDYFKDRQKDRAKSPRYQASFKEKVIRSARKEQRQSRNEQKLQARIARAQEILKAAKKSGQKPEAYLRARGIDYIPDNAYLLPASAKESPFPKHPCAVFEVKGGDACQVVALNERCDGKADIEDPKLTFGLYKGRYVELVPPDPDKPLIIAEGVETGLSASLLAGGLPAIATLGTSGMKAVRIPDCAEVIIAADNGDAGREAARRRVD